MTCDNIILRRRLSRENHSPASRLSGAARREAQLIARQHDRTSISSFLIHPDSVTDGDLAGEHSGLQGHMRAQKCFNGNTLSVCAPCRLVREFNPRCDERNTSVSWLHLRSFYFTSDGVKLFKDAGRRFFLRQLLNEVFTDLTHSNPITYKNKTFCFYCNTQVPHFS